MTAQPAPPALTAAPPLTATQQQLWALDQLPLAPAVLNLSYAVQIDGPLDVGALAGAFRDLVADHEVLRTRYRAADGSPCAEVADEGLALGALDLSPRQVASMAEAALAAREDRDQGFDLAVQAPIRAALLRLDEQRHILLLTLHHIAADGWSLYVLRQRLARGYAARLRGQFDGGSGAGGSGARGPGVQCADCARQQQDWLASPAAEQELSWWTDRLSGAIPRPPMLGPPTLGPPSGGASAELLRQVVVLPDQLTAELQQLSRRSSISLFGLLLTAFQVLIKAWSGCAEPVIGALAANRPTADSSRVLGAHYNTLLLNTDLDGDLSLAECLMRSAADTMQALDHQRLPGWLLAQRLEGKLGWDSSAVPGAMFLVDRYPLDGLTIEGCQVTGLYLDDGGPRTPLPGGGPPGRVAAATTADLIFAVREGADRLTLSVLYRPGVAALGEAPVIAAMRCYLEILSAMCDAPEATPDELELPFGEPLPGGGPLSDGAGSPAATASTAGPAAAGPAAAGAGPILRPVTEVAPVDAVSPVGWWSATAPRAAAEGASA